MAKAKGQKLEVAAEPPNGDRQSRQRPADVGHAPAVLYGKGVEATNLQVAVKEFERAYREAGESTLIYLNVGSDSYLTIGH